MLNVEKARDVLGKKYSSLSDERMQEIIDLILNIAKMFVDLFLAWKLK